jgi:hypothetical protein
MELSGRKTKPQRRKKRSFSDHEDYKPLQNKFMRGEYQEHQETPYYQDDYYQPEEAYDYGEYQEYEEVEEGGKSSWGALITFLLLALVVGFVVGILVFTSDAQNILSLGN